jgi:hypothetical protein
VVNAGGWLLLSVIFGSLLMMAQRSARNRRVITIAVLIAVWSVVWGYGMFRISTDCADPLRLLCGVLQARQDTIAWNTLNTAALTAAVVNFFFWFLIGRYNPPRTGDEMKVYGMND